MLNPAGTLRMRDVGAQGAASLRSNLSPVMKRTEHGGTAWSLPAEAERLRQPQDGSASSKFNVASIEAAQRLLEEPEDARLTGGTRSLTRRLLGLNLGLKKSGAVAVAALATQRPRVA